MKTGWFGAKLRDAPQVVFAVRWEDARYAIVYVRQNASKYVLLVSWFPATADTTLPCRDGVTWNTDVFASPANASRFPRANFLEACRCIPLACV